MKLRILICVILLLETLCVHSFAQDVQTPKGVRRALLVGVESYTDKSNLPRIPNAVNDMVAICKILMELGFEEQNIHILTTQNTESWERPSKKNILTVIKNLIEESKSEDVLFLAFSGHGFENRPNMYFCTENTKKEYLVLSGIEICRDLLYPLKEYTAKFKWGVIDACRSPVRGKSSSVHITDIPEGIALFQSCSMGEFSGESSSKSYGLFTEQLLAAMNEANANENQDGLLTFQEICRYTTRQTRVVSKRNQNPAMKFDGEFQDFVFSQNSNRVKADKYFVAEKYDLTKAEIDMELYPDDKSYQKEQQTIQ